MIGEKNKLIAEFVGLPHQVTINQSYYNLKNKDNTGTWYPIKRLQYHTSWDWLMPVVDKINQLGKPKDVGYPLFVKCLKVRNSLVTIDINLIYNEVTEFIEWYNTNHPLTQ